VLAYPSYVNWRPVRLARTLKARGVLPEWRRIVAHHREKKVRAEISEAGLTLERVEGFGPPGLTKWHLWWTRKA
jgi:glycogen(starch) synthase